MSMQDKPMLDAAGQIEHLSNKGVKFDIESKKAALEYLSKNNNYFKIRAYRKNYDKHPGGEFIGKYVNLDFAYLKDMAIIDMRLRYILLHMALDVEHYAKVKLLNIIDMSHEDGYSIVEDFIKTQRDDLNKEFERNSQSPYCGDIIQKYKADGFPIWAFVEIISFGRFVNFYKFCAGRLGKQDMVDEYYLMLSIKDLRNAAAHNNCILNDLKPKNIHIKPNTDVMKALGAIGISKSRRQRKMSNIRIHQITTLLYTHWKIVTSSGVHEHQANVLQELITGRMFKNKDYYKDNEKIYSTFIFLKQIVDNWYQPSYTKDT